MYVNFDCEAQHDCQRWHCSPHLRSRGHSVKHGARPPANTSRINPARRHGLAQTSPQQRSWHFARGLCPQALSRHCVATARYLLRKPGSSVRTTNAVSARSGAAKHRSRVRQQNRTRQSTGPRRGKSGEGDIECRRAQNRLPNCFEMLRSSFTRSVTRRRHFRIKWNKVRATSSMSQHM